MGTESLARVQGAEPPGGARGGAPYLKKNLRVKGSIPKKNYKIFTSLKIYFSGFEKLTPFKIFEGIFLKEPV